MLTIDHELTDEQLADRIARRAGSDDERDEATRAFEQLYARHASWVLAYLSNRVERNDLEDVHQVIWQRIWERIPDSFHGGNFRVWLFRITRNYVIDHSRRYRPQLIGDWNFLAPASAEDGPEARLAERERQTVVDQNVERLDRQSAEIMNRRLRGESYDEICRTMAITRSRAYKLFHEAKEALTRSVARAY